MTKTNPKKLSVIRQKRVQERTGLPRSTMYQQIQEGNFPEPINLGPRSVGWLEYEIDDWLVERIKKRDNGRKGVR